MDSTPGYQQHDSVRLDRAPDLWFSQHLNWTGHE